MRPSTEIRNLTSANEPPTKRSKGENSTDTTTRMRYDLLHRDINNHERLPMNSPALRRSTYQVTRQWKIRRFYPADGSHPPPATLISLFSIRRSASETLLPSSNVLSTATRTRSRSTQPLSLIVIAIRRMWALSSLATHRRHDLRWRTGRRCPRRSKRNVKGDRATPLP